MKEMQFGVRGPDFCHPTVGGVQRLNVGASTLFLLSYTVTVGRYHYKHKSVFSYSRILVNNVIACVKNQVLPSIVACHDGNYIGDCLLLNSLYLVPSALCALSLVDRAEGAFVPYRLLCLLSGLGTEHHR